MWWWKSLSSGVFVRANLISPMRTALTSISVIRAYRVRARARRDISFRVTRCVSRHGCQRKRRVKGRRLSPHSACVCVFSVPVCAAHRIPDAWCVPHSGVRGRRRYATVNADDTRGFHPRVARDIGQQDRGWENARGLGGRIFGTTRSCASVSVRHLFKTYIQQSRRNCVCVCVCSCVYRAARQACPFKRGIFDRFQVYRIKFKQRGRHFPQYSDLYTRWYFDITLFDITHSDFIEVDEKITMKFVIIDTLISLIYRNNCYFHCCEFCCMHRWEDMW